LGLITASFAIGLINAAVAAVNVIWLREHLDKPRQALWLCGLTVVLLFGLTLAASRITAFAQDHLYFDRIVWSKQSQYQSLVVTNTWQKNDVRLFIDSHLQFAEADEYRYHEALVHPVLSWGREAETVLILGGGDGLAVREVLKHPNITRIDLVDLDPAMTDLGLNFPPIIALNEGSMQSELLNVINADAFVYVRDTDQVYDRIIIDFPDPHNEALSKLYSVEFYAMVNAILADDGALVSQSSSPFFAPHSYWTVGRTLEEVFPQLVSYNISVPSFGIWGFHIASKNPDATMGPLPDGLRSLTEDTFAASLQFTTDLLPRKDIPVNSIFDPVIYHLYLQDVKGF